MLTPDQRRAEGGSGLSGRRRERERRVFKSDKKLFTTSKASPFPPNACLQSGHSQICHCRNLLCMQTSVFVSTWWRFIRVILVQLGPHYEIASQILFSEYGHCPPLPPRLSPSGICIIHVVSVSGGGACNGNSLLEAHKVISSQSPSHVTSLHTYWCNACGVSIVVHYITILRWWLWQFAITTKVDVLVQLCGLMVDKGGGRMVDHHWTPLLEWWLQLSELMGQPAISRGSPGILSSSLSMWG